MPSRRTPLPSVGEYCSAVRPVEPSTAANEARAPSRSNSSGAGSPPAKEITPGRSVRASRPRVTEDFTAATRADSGGTTAGVVPGGAAVLLTGCSSVSRVVMLGRDAPMAAPFLTAAAARRDRRRPRRMTGFGGGEVPLLHGSDGLREVDPGPAVRLHPLSRRSEGAPVHLPGRGGGGHHLVPPRAHPTGGRGRRRLRLLGLRRHPADQRGADRLPGLRRDTVLPPRPGRPAGADRGRAAD